MDGERVLALDLGVNVGYFDGSNYPGCFVLEQPQLRAIEMYNWLYQTVIIDEDDRQALTTYDTIVIENAICQPGIANEVFLTLKTVTKLFCHQYNLDFYGFAPTEIKKAYTGDGRASKEDIINKVLESGIELPYKIPKTGPRQGIKVYNDHAADAVAIYCTYQTKKEAGEV